MFIYLLKTGACLAIFMLFYKLFLEKENIHIFKRHYLLLAVLASFIIPLITITSYVEGAEVTGVTIQEIAVQSEPNLNQIDFITMMIPRVLWTVYISGVLFFGIKFIINISTLILKIKKNPKQRVQPFINVLLMDLITPHTFFNYIFLNKSQFESKQIPTEVLLHEQTHAKQKHSFDVLIIEVLQVVFWFNPLLYLFQHAIKLNHEFLADQAVIRKGIVISKYQKILLSYTNTAHQHSLANAINYSSIKKRFTVMKKHTTRTGIWLRSLVLLPLLAILIYSFSESVILNKQSTIEKSVNKESSQVNDLQTITVYENITIHINKRNELLLNGENYTDLKSLVKDLKIFIKDFSPEQLVNTKVQIVVDDSVEMGFVTDVKIEINKVGLNTVKNLESTSFKILPSKPMVRTQDKATKAQIAEYNKLAKYYNAQSKSKRMIKLKDVKRLEYIYKLMTQEQKEAAEPFPDFPAPPPPPPSPNFEAGSMIKETPPPPPPIPVNATAADKKKYKKAIENYHNKYKEHANKYRTDTGEIIEIVDDPLPPPPPPPNPLDHMIELAKTGAIFYYEDKKISSDKAIDLVKKNKDLNIQVRDNDKKSTIVKISTKPIKL